MNPAILHHMKIEEIAEAVAKLPPSAFADLTRRAKEP
jgi:hypothetical protein